MKIQVQIKRHGKEQHEVLWFYEVEEGYKHCIGCIYNYQYQREDFKWLFDFISQLHWKLNKFSNCTIKETEERWEDWLDSYCDKTIYHKFTGMEFITRISDFGDSENCSVEDVLNFISKNTSIKFIIKN